MSPSDYFLNENLTCAEGTWAGDVKIMAASCILQADIYVATSNYRVEGLSMREVVGAY